MTDPTTKGRGGRPGLPTWVFVLAGALVVGAIAFYWWVGVHHKGDKVAWWAIMGDSAGPFSALFNAGALIAALWAVHLQRIESHDADASTRQQLNLMSDQLGEFAKAAQAQRALADSQQHLAESQDTANAIQERALDLQEAAIKAHEKLADAQEDSNRIALGAELAARAGAIATLEAGIASLRSAIGSSWEISDGFGRAQRELKPDIERLQASVEEARKEMARAKQERDAREILAANRSTAELGELRDPQQLVREINSPMRRLNAARQAEHARADIEERNARWRARRESEEGEGH